MQWNAYKRSLTKNIMGGLKMNYQQEGTKKECIDCGGEFIEKVRSIHYECEHCIGKHEDC